MAFTPFTARIIVEVSAFKANNKNLLTEIALKTSVLAIKVSHTKILQSKFIDGNWVHFPLFVDQTPF